MKNGNVQILLGDCMDIMNKYPDGYFDLAIVDPLYGININVNMGRRKGDKKSNYHKFAGEDSEAPSVEYFKTLKQKSRNQVIWGANHFIENFPFIKNSSCWLMWDKRFSEEVSFAQYEMAWTSFSGTCKKFDKHPNSQKNRIHPTQKPIALYDWIYKNYATKDMKILDTHLGSGSNAISAHYFGIKEFVGIELDEDYFCAACKRFEEQTMQLKLF